jgi:prolyl-tRNA synthetase
MFQSHLFTKTSREFPRDEASFNAQMLMRAGFIDKLGAGIYTLLPLGLRVLNKICHIIREEMDNIGGQELLLPALTPKEVWEATDRWDNFDALFKLAGADKKEYALGATHEEIITPLAQKHIFSYKDLPCALYQIQNKFRNEMRAKSGLLRGREFSMKDLYSFHAHEEDLDEYYKLVQKAYFKIFERIGLLDHTYLTFASGGAFSKYSHEFQTLTPAGEDKIHICDKCNIAVNEEIIAEQKVCPHCNNDKLREDKAVEVGNIFKLGTRFSSAFGFKYKSESGEDKDVIMGCYGMGPTRLMGTIVELYHDHNGIIWPEEVAPFKVHLIEIHGKEEIKTHRVKKAAHDLYHDLEKAGIDVLYDDRDCGAGAKFADADLIGCPYRIVMSEKTLDKASVELKRRDSEETGLVKINKVVEMF